MAWFYVTASADDTARVLVRGDIGGDGVSADAFDRALTAIGQRPTVEIVIHSRGGDPWEAMGAYNHLRARARAGARIVTRIENLALSSASLLAMAGDQIVAPRNAWMMLHNSAVVPRGERLDASVLRQRADLLDTIDGEMLEAYARHCSLERHELAARMAAETWLTAEQARAIGLVHVVEDPVAVAARVDLSPFAAAPVALLDQYHQETTLQEPPMPDDARPDPVDPSADPPIPSAAASDLRLDASRLDAIIAQAVQAETEAATAPLLQQIKALQRRLDQGERLSVETDVRHHVRELVAQGRVRPSEEAVEVETLLALPDDTRTRRIQALGGRSPVADAITTEWTMGEGGDAPTVTARAAIDDYLPPGGGPDAEHVHLPAVEAIAQAEAEHGDDWPKVRAAIYAAAGETP